MPSLLSPSTHIWFGGTVMVITGQGGRVMTVSPSTARTRLQAVMSGFVGDLSVQSAYILRIGENSDHGNAVLDLPKRHNHTSLQPLASIPFIDPAKISCVWGMIGRVQIRVHRGTSNRGAFSDMLVEKDYSRKPCQCHERIIRKVTQKGSLWF